jgi:DNA mismatch endonuclease (patch repair protein)
MQTQSRENTEPEARLRRLLWAKGRRYRVGYPVPGHPRRSIDIAFPGKRVAVFVDGCFWHRCPDHSVPVKNNQSWWHAKLARNVDRDLETTKELEAQGWRVLRVWEHTDPTEAADMVEQLLIGIEHASRLSPPQP